MACVRHQDVTVHEQLLCSWRAAGPKPSPRKHPPARRTESQDLLETPGEGSARLRLGEDLRGAIQEEHIQAEEGDDSPGRGGGPVELQ